jgi:hypothetical protein
MLNRKAKKKKPSAEPSPQEKKVDASKRKKLEKPAVIPESRKEGLQEIAKVFSENQSGKGFSMSELLKMDDTQKSLPDILGYPIGAQESDMYRMLERCRLTKHEMQVYTNAIHVAEHGFGYNYKSINLDFPIPFYGEYIVKKLRASVSVDGESLQTWERAVSTWVARLYATQQEQQKQTQRGIIQ